jgi:hypothetical protein
VTAPVNAMLAALTRLASEEQSGIPRNRKGKSTYGKTPEMKWTLCVGGKDRVVVQVAPRLARSAMSTFGFGVMSKCPVHDPAVLLISRNNSC